MRQHGVSIGRWVALVIPITCLVSGPLLAQSSPGTSAIIRWDRWGVPHIEASDERDLAFAFGWAQMEAHANAILRLYGAARGRAAEYWGSEHLDRDLQAHRLGIPRRAGEWLQAQPPAMQRRLSDFAAGMNAWAREHPERIEPANRRVLPVAAEDPLAQLQVAVHWQVVAAFAQHQVEGWRHAGSNAVAIAPSRSASGNTMLLIQPHPPWLAEYAFFEAHLKGPDIEVYGIASLGLPILVMGFNRDLGWAHTFNPVDGIDLYALERVMGEDGSSTYRFDGENRPFEVSTVSVSVRDEQGKPRKQKLRVERTVHGPVIAERAQDGKQMVLIARIAGLDRPHLLSQYEAMAQATNRDQFEQALRRQQLPMFNVVYADRHGSVLYLYNALIPERRPVDPAWWRGVVDGERASSVWGPYRPYEQLPRIVDPPSGFVRNSNDSPWFATFPPVLEASGFARDTAPMVFDLRAQQSARQVLGDPSLSLGEMIEMEGSTHSLAADRFLPELVVAAQAAESARLRRAAEILSTWDRKFLAHSRGAVLFVTWLQSIDDFVEHPWDAEHPLDTPRGLRIDKALQALSAAVDEVESRWGAADVAWGEVYRIRHAGRDLPASVGLSEAGVFRVGFFRPDGDGKRALMGGISWTSVIEFADRPRACGLLAYGNASEPGHPGVGEQLQLFSDNRLRPIAFDDADIGRWTVKTERLSHARGTGHDLPGTAPAAPADSTSHPDKTWCLDLERIDQPETKQAGS